MMELCSRVFPVRDYDLEATLTSGQAFRWEKRQDAWTGVIGQQWVRLQLLETGLKIESTGHDPDWSAFTHYLQLDVDLEHVLATFPLDEPMKAAMNACRGLRLLRQEPWECLASFILSSTKQIVQIRQIVRILCRRYGTAVAAPKEFAPVYSFPSAEALATASEPDLRACKMGFRAPYLISAARAVSSGQLKLEDLRILPVETARAALTALPGVGRKIADCVLLFAYGFQTAFPVDVWVIKALRQLYFTRRRPTLRRLHQFADEHFGPYAGFAQQYLFHYMRTSGRIPLNPPRSS